jgi:hypothetical protein
LDVRRAFVSGAKWWEYTRAGATMWQSDIERAEAEATMMFVDTDPWSALDEAVKALNCELQYGGRRETPRISAALVRIANVLGGEKTLE